MAKREKIPALDSKVGKYFIAKKKGKTGAEASAIAGYSGTKYVTRLEQTDDYKALERRYADVLQGHISLDEIAEKHKENILQDTDKGARNAAIKMALDKIEPDSTPQKEQEAVMVVFKK